MGKRIFFVWPNLAKSGSRAQPGWCPGSTGLVWFYTQRAAVHEEEKDAVTLDTLGERRRNFVHHFVSQQIPFSGPRAGCGALATQVERRRRAGGRGDLAGGQVPWLAGERTGLFECPRGRKGARSPRWQQGDATRILSGQLSSLGPHTAAQPCQTGTGGDKDTAVSPSALSWLTPQPVVAGLPRPTEALQQPGLAGGKGLIPCGARLPAGHNPKVSGIPQT